PGSQAPSASPASAAARSSQAGAGGELGQADVEASGPETTRAGCALRGRPLRRAAPRRLVALGDIHGDVRALAAALEVAGAVNAQGRWIGKDLVVVQTGDLLDRGDDEQQVIDWLERLEAEASAAGGDLIWLLGNHELMNAAGDLRYVTSGGFADFTDVPGLALAPFSEVPERARARVAAFAVRPVVGPYARILSGQDTARIVGDTVFSHAGVLEEWAPLLADVNLENRCFLAGASETFPRALIDQSGPLWTREWGLGEADCGALRRVLAALGVERMVVGHTTQPSGITSACDGTLWRIDVGLGASYGGPIQVLEIDAQGARALTGHRR
ncbi:MAG TPA: metallophosphoesterase, partial [Kofleriaceae bacterium]|nr:metallophosphoesterase [Kofleriaceae bacterium]